MLNDVKEYCRICLAYGYTDLRFGIDGLARVVQDNFSLKDPKQALHKARKMKATLRQKTSDSGNTKTIWHLLRKATWIGGSQRDWSHRLHGE